MKSDIVKYTDIKYKLETIIGTQGRKRAHIFCESLTKKFQNGVRRRTVISRTIMFVASQMVRRMGRRTEEFVQYRLYHAEIESMVRSNRQ